MGTFNLHLVNFISRLCKAKEGSKCTDTERADPALYKVVGLFTSEDFMIVVPIQHRHVTDRQTGQILQRVRRCAGVL